MKIVFIINSVAKNVNTIISEIESCWHPWIKSAEICLTSYQGHSTELAQNKAPEADLIIAVGGDGTLNEVVNGIMKAALNPELQPCMGLIPYGTANDFARIQKIPMSIDSLAQAIEKHAFVQVDIGKVHMVDSNNQILYFINVADSGMGGEVVKKLEGSFYRKIPSAKLRFALAIFTTFVSYKRKKVTVFLNDKTSVEGKILTLVVANSSAFGSGLIVAPDAKIDDGQFQVILGDLSLFEYLMGMGNLLKGKRLRNKGVKYLNASKIKVSGPKNLYTQIDGELAGAGDIEIECLHKAMSFLMPRS